jgi:protein TonB
METPNSKLQKSSVIFMQLGLIVALFAVYLALEYKSIKKTYAFTEPKVVKETDTYVPENINIIDKHKPKIKVTHVKKVIIVKPVIDKIKVIENNKKILNKLPTDLQETDIDPNGNQPLTVDQIPSVEAPVDEPDNLDFVKVEIKPTFFKCKDKKGEAQKRCFTKMMNKYINNNFDVDLAQELGLAEGNHRIYVRFVIDKNGNIVDVHSNATHPRLKKEAERVVKKLPKMIPGKQRTNNVNVKYNLPINFNVTY